MSTSQGMRAVRPLLVGLYIAAGLLACAGQRLPPPSTDIDEVGFRNAVRVLASDDFEGRKPGTPGEQKTVAFLVDQFRKLGLKPGNGDSYLQQVPLVEITAGEDAALSATGHGATRQLKYAEDMVIWTQRPVPTATLVQSELVFAGYGITAPQFAWDDYAGIDAHGKTVIVLVNDPGYGSKDPRVFHGNSETYYGRWTYKVEEAARHGAAGVLLIHDTAAAGYGWNAVVADHTGALLEAAGSGASAGAAIEDGPAIEGWVSGAAARALFAQAGVEFDQQTAAAAQPNFHAIPLGLRIDAAVHNAVRRFTSPNVIAVLPGARRKHEYVIYAAHWDHLGRQPPARGGGIYNGAVDNASGVAGLLMLAQSLKRTQPTADRAFVFIAFTGGEAGLAGSAYYVEHPIFPLRDTAGMLNLNALHIGGPTRDVMVYGFGNSEMEDYLRAAALQQGREFHADSRPQLGMYYRSDQLNFARAGVPGLYAQAGIDDAARGPAWSQLQTDDYLIHRYHQPADTYSAAWDVRGTLDDLRLYYEVGSRLARSRRFPRWYPNSEFRERQPP